MKKWQCTCGFSNKHTVEWCEYCGKHWTKSGAANGKQTRPKEGKPKEQNKKDTTGWPSLRLPQSASSLSSVPAVQVSTSVSSPVGLEVFGPLFQSSSPVHSPVVASGVGMSSGPGPSNVQVFMKHLQDACAQNHFAIPAHVQATLQEQMQVKSMQSQMHTEGNRLGKIEKKISSLERTIQQSIEGWHKYVEQVKAKLQQDHQMCLQVIRLAEADLTQAREALRLQQQASLQAIQQLCVAAPSREAPADHSMQMEIDGAPAPQPWVAPASMPTASPLASQVGALSDGIALSVPDIQMPMAAFQAQPLPKCAASVEVSQAHTAAGFGPMSYMPQAPVTGAPPVCAVPRSLHPSCYVGNAPVQPGPPPQQPPQSPSVRADTQSPPGCWQPSNREDPYRLQVSIATPTPSPQRQSDGLAEAVGGLAPPVLPRANGFCDGLSSGLLTPVPRADGLSGGLPPPPVPSGQPAPVLPTSPDPPSLMHSLKECSDLMAQSRSLYNVACDDAERSQAQHLFEHASRMYAAISQQIGNTTGVESADAGGEVGADPVLQPFLEAIQTAKATQAECRQHFENWKAQQLRDLQASAAKIPVPLEKHVSEPPQSPAHTGRNDAVQEVLSSPERPGEALPKVLKNQEGSVHDQSQKPGDASCLQLD
jgi:hypothetical protein